MSAATASGGKSDTMGEDSASLVAFAIDDATVQDLTSFSQQLGLTDAHIGRGGLDAAIQYLSRTGRPPRRLVVDISTLKKPLEELEKLSHACDPSVQVFVLGDHNDVTLYRSLLQLGVRDYRYKPMALDALRAWLDDEDGHPVRRTRTGRVIVLTGTRGGVGVTTIANQLARQLTIGKGQRRIVYVDTDLYGGTSSVLMGIPPNHALTEILHNSDRLDPEFLERTLTTTDQRLFVLAAQLGHAEHFPAETGMMKTLLDALAQHFHYVVVDLHQSGGLLANEVFNRADIFGLVADRSIHSARMITRLVMHAESRSKPPALHILLNNTRPPTRSRVESKDFEQAILRPISLDIPYDGKKPGLAEDLGEPLPENSEIARSVSHLASVLTGEASLSNKARAARWFRRST